MLSEKIMKRSLGLTLMMGIFVSSCNIPVAAETDPGIATAAALTVQAAINAPLASPASGESASTQSSSKPMLTVDGVTNCRTGPGTNYERVMQITPGQQVEVIGVLPPGYWIVSTSSGVCWVSAEFATPVGSVEAVPTVTAPPTPEGNTPVAPTFLQKGWEYYCYGTGEMEVTFHWRDNADNETGYHVLRNGDLVAELPANTTQFYDKIILLSGQSATYEIEAYNLIGFARSIPVPLTC